MNKRYGGISLNLKKNLREIVNKIKKMNDKEKIINIAFIGIIGIAMVFASNFFAKSNTTSVNEQEQQQEQPASTQANAYKDYQTTLKDDLVNILGQIDGVGKIDVMISFQSVEEKKIAYNTKESNSVTNENDSQGGERVTEQENKDQNAIMVNKEGNNEPLIITENYPEIKGVIVVAEGASNSKVKYKLMKAVENALDLPSHKVMIYAKK